MKLLILLAGLIAFVAAQLETPLDNGIENPFSDEVSNESSQSLSVIFYDFTDKFGSVVHRGY